MSEKDLEELFSKYGIGIKMNERGVGNYPCSEGLGSLAQIKMKKHHKIETSYVDTLISLRNMVESDILPKDDKAKAIHHIEALESLLWRYSA